MEDLTALAEAHLTLAHQDEHGRSAHLFVHDGPLRQSVIALTAGTVLDEHNAPPAASLHVLHGLVRLEEAEGDGAAYELRSGQLMRVPQARHSVRALHDSVLLLTAVTRVPEL